MRHLRALSSAIAIAACTAPAWALYKVVDENGRVTYTDRPPSTEGAQRTAVVRPVASPSPAGTDAPLPFALREPVRRYPVILYTAADCAPCEAARRLLLQRGIPYAEKTLATDSDARAFDQLGAGRMVPGLSVGTRQLRGLDEAQWISYLDAAGYPAASALPPGWKPPPATPLAPAPKAVLAASPSITPPAPDAQPARLRARPAPAPVPSATTLRF
jgi:glutaredoxin